MLKRYTPFLFLASSLLSITACSESKTQDPTPVIVSTTTLYGIVEAQSEVLKPLSKAGTTVMLEGTDSKATTDASGKYELRNVTIGKHILNVSRVGMGTLRYEVEVKTLDPIAFPSVILDQQTSTQVVSMVPVSKDTYSLPDEVAAYECQLTYNPQLHPAPKAYSMAVYVGKTTDTNNVKYVMHSTYSLSESTPPPAVRGSTKMRIAFHTSSLKQLGFASGDKVYIVAYGAPKDVSSGGIGREAYYFEPYSFDPATNRVQRVVANLNPNPVKASFTMP